SKGEDNDFLRIQNALGILSEAPLFIDDTPSPTILQMRAMARRLQVEHGLSLVIVDYLQLIQPRTMSDNMVQQVTEISRTLKAFARELNVPVLALSQLNRAVESRSPQIPRLSDLRDSGSLEQDADVVLFIYRPEKKEGDSAENNIAEIHIAKHRNGPLGRTKLFFDERRTSFRDLAKNYE
ncbi:MAG: replicative DNA helicase, partial [Candidatus Spechtbacteria bacterium]|nr:replicative DNA helicase [Candidatus Spechtbacteria bacterium]